VQAGSMGVIASFQMQLPLDQTPVTVEGTVQVYAPSPRGEPGDEFAGMVSVPVLLGPAVGSADGNFYVYRVESGDTLTKVAQQFLSDGQRWKDIYAVNRDVIGNNPNLIHPGQQLRIPM
jgi:nucleoid-associated protein YgaU